MLPGRKALCVRNWGRATVAFLLLFSGSTVLLGQGQTGDIRKFDEFGDLKTDDIQARLDLFAEQDQNARGFIVGYRRGHWPQGFFLRYIYGFSDYLVNKRGVAPERVNVVDGGTKEETTTELWLVPLEAKPPETPAKTQVGTNMPIQFDQLPVGNLCEGEFTMERQQPIDAIRFFGRALRENSSVRGFIFVHPSAHDSLNKACQLISDSKEVLMKEHSISVGRIKCNDLAISFRERRTRH